MATLTHAESKRLYSWWWSSHISPKNSKWLQENLTDVDGKVKAMIKLIEEDADSFARRAEMYYKKRPELMKMVEEFYRAYRALAERYDSAMGELRQAHRTMADAFSNQMPFLIPEESLSTSSQSEPQTPVTPHPIRSLLDFDDHPKDYSESSPQTHMLKRTGAYSDDGELYSVRKGLKQFKNIFSEKSIGNETSSLTEDKISSDCQEAVLKEEVKKLQDELSKLSSENQNLASRILLVTERSDKVETEVQSLRNSLFSLETEKASAIHLYENSLKKVSNFEAENFQERTFTSMLSSFEERCCFLEASNHSLQSKIEGLLHKAVLQEKEICGKQEELDKLYSSQEEALRSLERLRGESEEKKNLGLELGVTKEKLEEVESIKRDLEQQLQKTKEDNFSLQKHYLSSNVMIKNLQDEILYLKEAKSGLEDEVTELISKESALQQQLSRLKDDMEDLGRRHQFVIDQIESVGFNAETFHLSIKELQDENSELKNVFIKEKNENLKFLNKLGEMEKVSAKSSLLESSLTDAYNELEVLREKLEDQTESFRSLQDERSDLLSQKNTLISQVDHMAENLEKISVKNSMLENSLHDLTVELDGFRVKSKVLEEYIQSLQSNNSNLLSERDNLTTHVETIHSSLKDLERNLCETEKKNSCLNEEKELAVQQIGELELLLAQAKEEHSLFAESSNSIIANLKNRTDMLQEELELRNNELAEEEEKHLAAHTEVLVLQSCITDMKQESGVLFRELQMHGKALLNEKNHVSKLQEEVLELKKEVKLMEEIKLKQRVAINQVSRSLGIEAFGNFVDDIEVQIVLRQLSGEIERLKYSLLNSVDEIELLLFERSIDNLVLKEMRHEGLNVKSEKEGSDQNLMMRMKEISFLRTEAEKLLDEEKLLKNKIELCLHQEEMLKTERETLSSQLSEACKAQLTLANENYELLEENQSWKKEFCFLRDEKYILEEEYTTLLKEALSHNYLYLIFEKFSSEKAAELRELNFEVEDLQKVCCDLKEVSEMTGDRMKEVEMENVLLKENIVKLESYRCQFVGLENEIVEIRGHIEQLNDKIEMGKQLLSQKEIDLSNALMNIEAKNGENIKLRDEAKTLEGECCEAKLLIESLKGSLNLAENKARHDEKQYMELVGREEWLMSELKRNVNEVEIWEAEVSELYEALQVAEVIALVYQQKAYELAEKCESLQERYMDQIVNFEINKSLIDAESEKMKSKLFALELENEGLRQEVAVHLRLIMSLKDGIIRLEEQALSIKKFQDKEIQIPDLGYAQQSTPADKNDDCMDGFELFDYLQEKIDSVGNALLESKSYFEEENAKATEQLETAKMEIEVLKERIKMMQGEVGSSRNARLLKDEGDISHIRMKDIQLDQVSDRNSPRLASDVYAGPFHQIEEVDPFRFEKSLGVGKIESSRLSGGTQEGSKRILEKLEMDSEKLTNIQASVFDTQNRIKRVDKDKLTSFEHDSFMTHLREIEGAISQLFDMRGKLLKNADEESLGSGRRVRRASERGLSNRRQTSEQLRRWSEKIARMELEVQQIRFLLFKLEEEYDMKKKKKTMERRVQLRDYLYGGTHDSYRKKKRHLCACIQPMTKED